MTVASHKQEAVVSWLSNVNQRISNWGPRHPQGALKLKSGSREILKYLKNKYFYVIDPLKKLNKLVKKHKSVVFLHC
jgi:hypothetical protein